LKGWGDNTLNETKIIDAHVHLDPISKFYAPSPGLEDLLKLMDRLSVGYSVCIDHLTMYEGAAEGIGTLRDVFEKSGGRIHYLGGYNPRKSRECMDALKKAVSWSGFAGIKIHPSFHLTPADDPAYETIWKFADKNNLAILAHSWSVSDYNPAQSHSTPEKFEKYISKFRDVRIVLAHAGGRGSGRGEMIRLVNKYENVYTDIAGDIFCYRLLESLTGSIPAERVLFGSDFPWLDPRANLARVFLSNIDNKVKNKILAENAMRVYGIE
jgi:predicted TIM-barrel fold metal-dependent hydrolase